MVPREIWPGEACEELQGAGWLVEVVRTVGKAESAKALCRFVAARTQEGQLIEKQCVLGTNAAIDRTVLVGIGAVS